MHQPLLGEKIVQLRKGLNLTQDELAKKSNLGLRTIQRIESGRVMPRNSTIDLLLDSLGKDRQSLGSNMIKKVSLQSRLATFFLVPHSTNSKLHSVLQTAWIAGIFYFLILIVEDGLEYLVFNETKIKTIWKASYILIKIWVLVSFTLFMRGFTALSKVFENSLLRISSYLMIGLMIGIVFSDIVKLMIIENGDLKVILTISKSIMAGITSLLFGVVLLRLQDSLGILSKYAGIIEVILGSCFIVVYLSPLALALLVPATVLEIIILYKGYEFINLESMGDFQNSKNNDNH
ncbi:helix-turn-helix domain-containing protein [Maribacter antarcticus]|uniref:helix-turn-helix domain-containing protein n=1 Tax=Maribacter antarcticus TaxID=505250 RepID=UPI00047B1A05|nr:helix-turn-helix transcriptional regulator [Maribacter antarcticus]